MVEFFFLRKKISSHVIFFTSLRVIFFLWYTHHYNILVDFFSKQFMVSSEESIMRPKVFGIVVAWNQPFLDRANFEPFFIPWIVPLILLNSTYSWDQYHPYSLWQIHLRPILRLHWYRVHGKFYLLFLQLHPKMTKIFY